MKIQEIVIFAHPTRGRALEIANSAKEDLIVAEIRIVNGFKPAKTPVAWIVIPASKSLVDELGDIWKAD